MTNKEAIEVITHFDKHIISCDEYGYRSDSDLMEAHLMAAKALRNGWIPVSERLPEDDRQVLACTKKGTAFSAHYDHRWKSWSVSHTVKITHWMPLPEPPKED